MSRYFYSPLTNAFFQADEPPSADCISITEYWYLAGTSALAAGKDVRPGFDGYPLIIHEPPSADVVMARARSMRLEALRASDYTELPSFAARNGEAAQQAWLVYRDLLREFPQRVAALLEDGADEFDLLAQLASLVAEGKPS